MNIFALSRNPQEAAQEMLDKHIVKMPTETCQMLHTNVLYFDYIEHYGEEPTLAQVKQFHRDINSKLMKPAMLNHPSTIWARQNPHNTRWLYEHGKALCEEYTYRYGKVHGSQSRILDIAYTIGEDSNWSFATPITIAMDDKYRLVKDNRMVTKHEIYQAIKVYIAKLETASAGSFYTWGGGDSLDCERVRDIMNDYYGVAS